MVRAFIIWTSPPTKPSGRGKARHWNCGVEAFNALNHFNPSNPNSTLTYNFATGAQTNASFGAIGGTQHNARRLAVSLKFRF